jgi:HK97 family phage major capsid protein/HK97 family phage prohead protease
LGFFIGGNSVEKRQFKLEIESRDKDSMTIKGTLSTETPVSRGSYQEILLHEPDAIDLSRGDLPLLEAHDASKINIGVVENLKIVGNKLKGVLRFGKSARAKELWQDVQAKIIRGLSIGYEVIESEKATKDNVVVTRWRPLEVSLVPIPADVGAVIGRSKNNMEIYDDMSIEELENLVETKKRNFAMMPSPSGDIHQKINREKAFPSLGEYFQSIQRAHSGGGVDPRLTRAVQGLSEGIGSDGGFLLQPQFVNEVMTNVWQTGEIMKRCYSVPMKTNSLQIPGVDETSRATGSRAGGIRGYWLAEGATKTESQPKFRRIELNLRKAVVLIPTTDELLDDAEALDAFIRSEAEREIRFTIENAIFNGNGAGMPLGILNAGCTVEVSKETGQASGTIEYANILKMYARLREDTEAAWFIDRSCIPQLATMSVAVGTGGSPVWMPANGAAGQPYNTLLGLPVIIHEHGATVGTVGDICLCDMSKYVLAYKPIESAMSIHVYFTTDQSLYRLVMRVDGQPKLASAITPKSGGDTVTDFVTLESR